MVQKLNTCFLCISLAKKIIEPEQLLDVLPLKKNLNILFSVTDSWFLSLLWQQKTLISFINMLLQEGSIMIFISLAGVI